MFLKLECPAAHLLAGPSQSGKTSAVLKIIKHRDLVFKVPPQKIVYAYGAWQPSFDKLKSEVEFHSGLPTKESVCKWTSSGKHSLLIMDDVMEQACQSQDTQAVFSVYSHHRNVSVIFLVQNVFSPGRFMRTISLNCHYIWLFKTKRDCLQVQSLGKQILPSESRFFMSSYQDATAQPYSYLLIDLHPITDKKFQLRTHIFPDEVTWIYTPRIEGVIPDVESVTIETS